MLGRNISHYRILEKLGGGGMGVVYRAEDTVLRRSVALKFLPEEITHDKTALERFLREARAAAALSHAHVCTVYEIGEQQGEHFIAMELLEGKTLGQHIGGRPLPINDVLELSLQLTDALVTGRQAFCGETTPVLVQRILTDSPPPASRSNPLLPERLEEIIGKALEKDRELRYQSAAEMRPDLKRLKRDLESAALRTTT